MGMQQQAYRNIVPFQVGEFTRGLAIDSTQSLIISSPTGVVNQIGYAYTYNSDGTVRCGGTGVFAGILAFPKTLASKGTGGDPLAPTFNVNNGVTAAIATMGAIGVLVQQSASIGDWVVYNTTTGQLNSLAHATTTPPSGYALIPHAMVDYNAAVSFGSGVYAAEIKLGRV